MYGNIVNGTQLQTFINKKVSLTGLVTEKAPNGIWFEMRTTDNLVVRINLKRPIDQPLDGYVEVHGTSTGKGVNADETITFENTSFDGNSYNYLCQILHTLPNLWDIK